MPTLGSCTSYNGGTRFPFGALPPHLVHQRQETTYPKGSLKWASLNQPVQELWNKGAIEPAPLTPGFYSHFFPVTKTTGEWRPIIDLSSLNVNVHCLSLHYGDASVNPQGPTTGPVVNIPRPERCLLSHRDQPSRQTLPTLLSQRHRMAVHSTAIRVVNQSESIYQNPTVSYFFSSNRKMRTWANCWTVALTGLICLTWHHSPNTFHLATDICQWAEKRGMTLVPRHLPGHLNVLVDHLSRRGQILKTEWSLNQTIADRIFCAWGRPFMDLFALGKNTKLATYISPIREETAWKMDSLVQNWDGLYAYAYPPTSLIRACLNKVRTESVEIILIAPVWPNQEWFPDLLDLAIDFQISLPPVQKLLKQTFSHHSHPHPWNLNLHAGGYQGIPQGERIFWSGCPVARYISETILSGGLRI